MVKSKNGRTLIRIYNSLELEFDLESPHLKLEEIEILNNFQERKPLTPCYTVNSAPNKAFEIFKLIETSYLNKEEKSNVRSLIEDHQDFFSGQTKSCPQPA